jgi:hypothetical protein
MWNLRYWAIQLELPPIKEPFDNLQGFVKRPARLFLAKFADMG